MLCGKHPSKILNGVSSYKKLFYDYILHMNIVFLSYYSGINSRGVETFVHELSNRLTTAGHQITVFQTGPKLPDTSYTVITMPSYSFTKKSLEMITSYPDIIIPTNGEGQSYLCRFWAWSHRVKMVITGHSGPGIDDRLNLWSFPDVFVGLTDYQCAWAKSANPFIKVAKISNGVDLAKFNTRVPPADVKLPHPILLCVGALEPIKRQETLIQAAEKTTASVLLVGQGEQLEYLTQLGNRRLPGRFAVTAVPYSQMPSIYRACDLFVYPTSPWESFGIAMIEALASGLPVLANDDPIRREIVGKAGDFVNPSDTRVFTNTINECLGKNWASLPVQQAAQYSWNQISGAYENLFYSLLKQPVPSVKINLSG